MGQLDYAVGQVYEAAMSSPNHMSLLVRSRLLMAALLTLSVLNGASKLHAQETFNVRDRYDQLAFDIDALWPTDSCIYAIARGIDGYTGYLLHEGFFMKFDLEGQLMYMKSIRLDGRRCVPMFAGLHAFKDDFLLVAANDTIPNTFHRTRMFGIIMNDEGDVVNHVALTNPVRNNGLLTPWSDAAEVVNDSLILLTGCYLNVYGNYTPFIMTWDGEDEVNQLWEENSVQLEVDNIVLPYSLKHTPDGNYLIGMQLIPDVQVDQDFWRLQLLIKIDPEGNQVWRYQSPPEQRILDGPTDMIPLDDGSVIIATGAGYEKPINQSRGYVVYAKLVYRLDSLGDVIWRREFHDLDTLSRASITSSMIDLPDEEAFILTGESNHLLPDSLRLPDRSESQSVAWIGKITYDGEVIWIRKHAYVWGTFYYQDVFDAAPAHDGGIVLSGIAGSDTEYPQQGWLIKIDGDGCMVPGCQDFVSVEDVLDSRAEAEILIYPNPVQDVLNFTVPIEGVHQIHYQLGSLDGQILRRGHIQGPMHTTMMLDVSSLAAGTYMLTTYLPTGQLLTTKKILKL